MVMVMRRRRPIGSVLGSLLLLVAVEARGQSLGTFSWQFSPFCNVVTLAVVRDGAVATLTGSDDQCGGPARAAASGTAFVNPDGTIGMGLTIVPPGGAPVTSAIVLDATTFAGNWTDSGGNAGPFVFQPPIPAGGSPRPVGAPLAGTDAAAQFLGTTGNAPLELRVNGGRALRLEPASSTAFGTSANVLGGSSGNTVTTGVIGATIAGGGSASGTGCLGPCLNQVTDDFGTVGGGGGNQAGDGSGTTDDRSFATVGGGFNNTASGFIATVSGGISNTAIGTGATVGGGGLNAAGCSGSETAGPCVALGATQGATIPGGGFNDALGNFSFAAGRQAKAHHHGAFVWGDSTVADVLSERGDQFRVRANGGARFDVNNGRRFEVRDDGVDLITTSTGAHLTLGGVWTSASDAARKTDFAPVDARAVLEQLGALPILSWRYRVEGAGVRHLGPTAQAFYATFGLGGDDRGIGTVDADGVALVAIQALYRMVLALERKAAALEAALSSEGADLIGRASPFGAPSEAFPNEGCGGQAAARSGTPRPRGQEPRGMQESVRGAAMLEATGRASGRAEWLIEDW